MTFAFDPRGYTALILFLGVLVAGCASNTAAQPIPTPKPVPPTPTTVIGFQVAVTPIATQPGPGPTPTTTATPFHAPSGSFMTLLPPTGPPASRTIQVRAGHLPPKYTVMIGFSPGARSGPLTTTAYTDAHGSLRASYVVPASPPGDYTMSVLSDGVLLARAIYKVVSLAVLNVSVGATQAGSVLSVTGEKFLPDSPLLLVAYPISNARRHIILGRVASNAAGGFQFALSTKLLSPGAYRLRAWSQSALAAQFAETYFQVVV